MQVWQYGLRYGVNFYSGAGSVSGPCALLVAIPRSAELNRPYWFYADPNIVRDRLNEMRRLIAATLVASFLALLGSVLFVSQTYPDDEGGWFGACAGSAGGVFLISCAFALMFGLVVPTELGDALDYYAFVDALPRTSDGLLPLPWGVAARLFVGPPHPTVVPGIDFAVFFWAAGILHALWFGAYLFRIALAVAWVRLRLPIEERWEQATREGCMLSIENITEALQETVKGRSDWELDVLRRKAHMFALKLQQSARAASSGRAR
jgi:hypothetical protein